MYPFYTENREMNCTDCFYAVATTNRIDAENLQQDPKSTQAR
jgi:hypothetical protein